MRRKCHECRYLRDQLGLSRGPIWSLPVSPPTVVGQIILADSAFDRWFSGFPAYLERRKLTNGLDGLGPLHHIKNSHPAVQMIIMRCAGCVKWREWRAFRVGGASTPPPGPQSASGGPVPGMASL